MVENKAKLFCCLKNLVICVSKHKKYLTKVKNSACHSQEITVRNTDTQGIGPCQGG